MTVLVFVLFWIVVGLGLLFVALSGGPRGARERLHKQSRRGRRISYALFALVLIAWGIAVPAAVVAGMEARDSVPESGIASLTPLEERGREVFGTQCRICHSLRAAGAVSTVGPDLDQLRPTKALVLDAIENGRARGNGAMAADLVEGRDAEAIAAFVAKAVGQTDAPPAEQTGEPPAEQSGQAE